MEKRYNNPMFLNNFLNKLNAQDLPSYHFETGREDIRGLYFTVFSLLAPLDLPLKEGESLWLGFDGKIFHGEIIQGTDYVSLHEKYKTDSNLLIGHFNYDLPKNKFNPSTRLSFFVDSWNGCFYGQYSPFKIEVDRLHQSKKVA